jgi:hypothetical protein
MLNKNLYEGYQPKMILSFRVERDAKRAKARQCLNKNGKFSWFKYGQIVKRIIKEREEQEKKDEKFLE